MSEVLETYVSRLSMDIDAYGITMVVGTSPPGRASEMQPRAVLRMSHVHAKVMAMLTRKQLKEYERKTGAIINVPHDAMDKMELAEEDW
ncbi:MAG: hypothetical protein ABIH46_11600 [Chloroflexota bacterium]